MGLAKKTYRDTRWMERVISIISSPPSRNVEDWACIGPNYVISVQTGDSSIGWVKSESIRMTVYRGELQLQFVTDVGMITLTPSCHERIKVRCSNDNKENVSIEKH